MKQFAKYFGVCYIVFAVIFIYLFGNMNFFGTQGFHLNTMILVRVLVIWAPVPSIIVSGIIVGISRMTSTNKEVKCPKCGRIRANGDNYCPKCGYDYSEDMEGKV